MKKLLSLLLIAVTVLMGCGKHSDGTSVWAAGLWIIPVATFLGSVAFFYVGWTAHRSGSEQWDRYGRREFKENIPLVNIPQFWAAVALAVVTLIIIWAVNAEK